MKVSRGFGWSATLLASVFVLGCDAISTKERVAADLYKRVEARDCLAYIELEQRKEKGEHHAGTYLGLAIQRGLGQNCYDRDLEALRAYELSAGKVKEVDFNVGLILLKRKEFEQAEVALLRAAGGEKRNGLPRAMVKLAQIYEAGLAGFPNSESLSGQWYEAAAEQGDLYALTKTALRLLDGKGVKKNEKRAIEMLEHAAQKGVRDARLALFTLANDGRTPSGRREPEVAAKWLGSAAIVDSKLTKMYEEYLQTLSVMERKSAIDQVLHFKEHVREVWVEEKYDEPIAPKSLGETGKK